MYQFSLYFDYKRKQTPVLWYLLELVLINKTEGNMPPVFIFAHTFVMSMEYIRKFCDGLINAQKNQRESLR